MAPASTSILSRTLYRALFRQVKQLCSNKDYVVLWSSLPLSGWGKFRGNSIDELEPDNKLDLFGLEEDVMSEAVENFINDEIISWPTSPVIRSHELVSMFKDSWKRVSSLTNDDKSKKDEAVDVGFDVLRMFAKLKETSMTSNVNEVDGIRIACKSQWVQRLADGSDTFVYRLYIENVNEEGQVQLIGRHWVLCVYHLYMCVYTYFKMM
jgi:hypothetical protein